jgi:3'-5' exoribonuclease
MDLLSIRELKSRAGENAEPLRVHAQLEIAKEKTSRAGKPYYELKFCDAEDSLVLRAWNDSPEFLSASNYKAGSFFEIQAEWWHNADFNSLDSRNWKLQALGDDDIDRLLAGSDELRAKQEADFQFIVEAIDVTADPRLRALGNLFLEKYGTRFRRTGAARDYHHARRGGLVEHVAQMMRSAVQICVAYPTLNRDLLVAGVLFHDVGKLWENAYAAKGFTMPYLAVADLLGHIPMGAELVNKLWHDLLDSPIAGEQQWITLEPSNDQVRLHLLHLILAHHGEMAFGSPVVPKTPEAYALHYIDNLDAKMEMFDRGYQIAGRLGKDVYERVRPLPGRLVEPLESFFAAPPEAAPESEAETSAPEEQAGSDLGQGSEETVVDFPVAEVNDSPGEENADVNPAAEMVDEEEPF